MKNFPVSQQVEMIGGDVGMDKLQWGKFGLVLVTHSLPLCTVQKQRTKYCYLPATAGR